MTSNSAFLSPDEMTALTGYVRRSGQIAWLRERGWRFELDRDGRPRVARAFMERRMVGETVAQEAPEPNWAALGVR